ncbi:hypothetical protein ACFWIR_33835, partial [Streptomyces olivaceus]
MSSRTVIRGGLVVTASDELHADVLIEDGRVAALAASGTPAAGAFAAERVIDATGKYVIPGGVDGHTHMEMPFGGTYAPGTLDNRPPGRPPGGGATSRPARPVGGPEPGRPPSPPEWRGRSGSARRAS